MSVGLEIRTRGNGTESLKDIGFTNMNMVPDGNIHKEVQEVFLVVDIIVLDTFINFVTSNIIKTRNFQEGVQMTF